MCLAAVALRFAFPHEIYIIRENYLPSMISPSGQGGAGGRIVTMQSISNNLKETMNPKDIMHDAIHNFHPQYRDYTQYNAHANDDRPPMTSSNINQNSIPSDGPATLPIETTIQGQTSILQNFPNKLIPKSLTKKDAEKDMLLINDDV